MCVLTYVSVSVCVGERESERVSVCVLVSTCICEIESVWNSVNDEYQQLFVFDREEKTLGVGLWIFVV